MPLARLGPTGQSRGFSSSQRCLIDFFFFQFLRIVSPPPFALFSDGEMGWYNCQVLLKLSGPSTEGLCASLKMGSLGFPGGLVGIWEI